MKFKRLLCVIVAYIMLSVPVYAEFNSDVLYFDAVLNYMSNLYIDDDITIEELYEEALSSAMKENPELMYSMIKSAFSLLDEYSEFYTAEEYQLQYQRLNHIFYGIGVLVQQRDGYTHVIQVHDGGGAQLAGILEGDVIIAVDNTSVYGYSLDEVVEMISGEEGTYVNIKILRNNIEMNFNVVRKQVSQSTSDYALYEDNVGYLAIYSFSNSTPTEVKEALTFFDEKGISDIIIDLRNNPGGILMSVIQVANEFVPEGPILHTMYRDETKSATYNSTNKSPKYNIAVLVNGETASAAEVLTGALQDSGVGYVIGDTTFGKGLIQDVFSFPNGDAFKITTGHYLTRNGRDIQGVGISPDETVINTSEKIDTTQYEAYDGITKWRVGDYGKGVLATKQRLNILGYYHGTIDENFDSLLEHSVNQFQKDTGLYPYGVVDYATQRTLNEKFSEINIVTDNQFDTAYKYLTLNR